MARINVEQDFYTDPRFLELAVMTGSRFTALGICVAVWECAQKYWKSETKLIPKDIWEKHKFGDEILKCGLVEEKENGFYAKGSESHFKWILERQESGRKGGLAKASLAKQSHSFPKPLPPSPSPSPSPSPTLNILSSNTNTKERALSEPSRDIGSFIKVYVSSFQKRFGKQARPDLSGKVQGQIKSFLKGRKFDDASLLIQTYFQIEDKWFETKAYDFGTFLQNIQKVQLALQTGRDSNNKHSDKEHDDFWGRK